LFGLGQQFFKQKRCADAEIPFREALDERRATVGEHHKESLDALYWVARSVHDQEHYSEAETFWRELVAARRVILGDNTLSSLDWLASCIFNLGRCAEAKGIWEEVVEGRREVLGAEHADTLVALDWFDRSQRALDSEGSPANPSTEQVKVEGAPPGIQSPPVEDTSPEVQPGPVPEREDTSIASNEVKSDLGTQIPAQIPLADGQ
jgi:hypothetical protein